MLTQKTIGFLGAGNMAEALIKGLLSSGIVGAGQIVAADRAAGRLVHMAETYNVRVLNQNYEAAKAADIIFITVKPADVEAALREIAPEVTAEKLIISVAAGVTTEKIFSVLRANGVGAMPALVRTMPNTPATVQTGMTALYAAGDTGKDCVKMARAIFEAVGKTVVVAEESLMDAVTGLSGSGPAYVFLFMEALVDAGVNAGLKKEDARTMAIQTTLGAARLAMESTADLAELRQRVSSPGGTTVEGLKKLEEGRLREVVDSAVQAATRRSTELSGKQ